MKTSGALLALLAALALVACGGGGEEFTPEEYFQQIEAIVDDFAERTNALGEPPQAKADPDTEFIRQLRDYLDSEAALWRNSVDDFRRVGPPANLVALHKEAVEARNGRAKADEELTGQLDRVSPQTGLDELESLFLMTGQAAAAERSRQACLTLQRAADTTGIDVELQCIVFTMQGVSMAPTITNGDRLIVNEYGVEPAAARDLIVFLSPRDAERGVERDFVKRIIAVPGDAIAITSEGGQVLVNGQPIEEPYIQGSTRCNRNCGPWEIPPANTDESIAACGSSACYFVMGDNRQNSSDSRQGWLVPEENIFGWVVAIGPPGQGATW